ncbi:MAG: hypothetical protein PVF63_02025 [Gammaproteobacteria bacterium]|jgi:hypothetical protein
MTHRIAALVSLLGVCSLSARAQPGDTDPASLIAGELEYRNTTIREIRFNIGDVFDTSNPEEDKRLYRLANRIHIRTKQRTVESVLLSQAGDSFDVRLNEESARALRARNFISDASIVPVDYDESSNTVALQVNTQDAWSLSPDLKFSRSGGENEIGIGISEENLFGLGKDLTLSRTSDVDRDEIFFGYADPNVRGTRTRLNVVLADASDGHRSEFVVGRPFYALDSRWAVETAFSDIERVDSMYGLGEVIDEFRHEIDSFSVWGGWSRGLRANQRTRRWLAGVTSEERRFAPAPDFSSPILLPGDRKLVYPWIGVQIAEDDFRQMRELNDMGRTEDVALGLNLSLRLGYAADKYGSDRDAAIFRASAHKGWEPGGAGRLFLFDLEAQARRESDGIRNSIVQSTFRYYRRNFDRQLLTVSLSTTLGRRLDPENQVLLGGDSDLRGYPLRYQSGEGSAVLTVEQRFFTDWYPFRLVRIGYAVFADIGRVWGHDARGTPNLGTLYDVGIGLRFTSPRASSGSVVHVDLAFPVNAPVDVDSMQLTIEKKRSF